jgi:hypothetical protein
MTIPTGTTPLQVTIHPLPKDDDKTAKTADNQFWNSGGAPSFKDVLDTINPLQHIPIVSSIYQSLTGDVPSAGAKITGGALFGGPIGLVASIFDSIVQSTTGTDIAGNMLAAVQGKDVPALHTQGATDTASNAAPDHLGANQRAAYNAYVQTQGLTA